MIASNCHELLRCWGVLLGNIASNGRIASAGVYTPAQLKASSRIENHGQALVDLGGLGWGVLIGNIAKIAIATLRLGLQALRLLREAMPRLLGSTPRQHPRLTKFIF